jgi:pyruvate,water dikinase
MECAAMKKVRNELGLTNVQVMVPFVRTWTKPRAWSTCWPSTAWQGENELKLIMMCEIPSNALLAESS